MKKIKSLIVLLMFLGFSFSLYGAEVIRHSISSDIKEDGALLVKNSLDKAKNSAAYLEFDISALNRKYTAWAQVSVSGKLVKDAKANPSLYLECDGKIIATITTPMHDTVNGNFNVTEIVNHALANGNKNLKFKLSQRGIADAQCGFLMTAANLSIAPEKEVQFSLKEYITPFGDGKKIVDESIFFIGGEDGSAPFGRLLYIPTKILRAKNFMTGEEYKEGLDFKVEGDKIIALPNTKMFTLKYSEMYLDNPKQTDLRTFKFPTINKFSLSPEGKWFHEKTIYFTYEHDGKGDFKPPRSDFMKRRTLPKTLKKLEDGQNVKIVLYGDSISAGANASGRGFIAPYMDSWGALSVDALKSIYTKANITYMNAALGGTTLKWGVTNVDTHVAQEKPDLVILAFGMNGRDLTGDRTKMLNELMNKVSAKNPDAEFIIVTSMMPNENWRSLEPHSLYSASDAKMKKEGVEHVDVWSVHKQLLKIKKYEDMTGNNVNHPNDFLIRVYAYLILSKF